MRQSLDPGTIIRIREGEYYKIVGDIIGNGGGSIVYPCVRMVKKDEEFEELNNLRYVIKECFPVSSDYTFTRNTEGEIIPEKDDPRAAHYLKSVKQMQLCEQQITGHIYQKGFRLIPIVSTGEVIGLSFDDGASFHTVQNMMTVMESLDQKGKSLKAHLKDNGGKLPAQTAFHVIEQTLLAVKEVHDAGYLHLDIQEGNLFIKGSLTDKNDMVSLIDFGTARKRMEDGYTDLISDRVLFATDGFSAPELISHNDGTLRIGPEADIYSIGYILLMMLTGRYYDAKEIAAVTNGHYITGRKLRQTNCPKHMTERMQGILAKALAQEPENRYHSCDEMLSDVSDFASALNPYRSDLAGTAYDAFICYRHGEVDSQAAIALQKNLEHFGRKSIVKKNKLKKIEHVFVDEGELSSCADFGLQIREALKNSGWLIVICSPGTKDSPWVNLEISTFLEFHDRSRILAVLTDGEPEEVFPDLLLGDSQSEMVLAADARDIDAGSNTENTKPDAQKILKNLRGDALLKVAAPILGTTFDSLKQRNRIYKFQRIAAAASLAGIVLLAFSLYTVYESQKVQEQYQQTQIALAKNLAKEANEQLDEGDRIGALETLLESAQGNFNNRDEPIAPEQMYSLNQALYTCQYNQRCLYSPLCMQEMEGSTTEGNDLNTDSGLFMSIDSLGYAYFYDTNSGNLIWKTSSKDFFPYSGNAFMQGKFINASEVLLITQDWFYIVDVNQKECKKAWKSVFSIDEYTDPVFAVCNNQFAISDFDTVYLYDLTTDDPSSSVETIEDISSYAIPSFMTFSDDNSHLIICVSTKIMVIDTKSLEIKRSISCVGEVDDAELISDNYLAVLLYSFYDYQQSNTSTEMQLEAIYDLNTGDEVWKNDTVYYNDYDLNCEGIRDLGEITFTNDEVIDCICFYNQNNLVLVSKEDWDIVFRLTYESKITGIGVTDIGETGQDHTYLVMFNTGTVDKSFPNYEDRAMLLDNSNYFSYYCPATDTIIMVGSNDHSHNITFSKQMRDEQMEPAVNYSTDDTSGNEYCNTHDLDDTSEDTSLQLTTEHYCCTYKDGEIVICSLQDNKEIMTISSVNEGHNIIFRFFNNERNFITYDSYLSELTVWNLKSQEIVTQQNLDLDCKNCCYVNDDQNLLILECNGDFIPYDKNFIFKARSVDILYYDDDMNFYQYANIPYAHYDSTDEKIYIDDLYNDVYCSNLDDLCSYKTLLQEAQNTVDDFYANNYQETS